MGGTTGAVFEDVATAGGEGETLSQETPLASDSTVTTTTDTSVIANKTTTEKTSTATATLTTVNLWATDKEEVGSTSHQSKSTTFAEGKCRLDQEPLEVVLG